jgi:hypothetical protein
MNRNQARLILWLVSGLVLPVLVACAPQMPAVTPGSGYRDVSKAMLIGSQYSHRTGRAAPQLTWTFSESEFEIVSDSDLPPDLVEATTGSPRQASRLTGKWDLQGESLLISNVQVDGVTDVPGERIVRVFFTGVIRVQTLAAQYVFDQARPDRSSPP